MTKLCFLVLLGLAATPAFGLGSRAEAQVWLKAHQSPDDLAELAKADPNSYAIVKALLAKQQMGLLKMGTNNPAASESSSASESSAAGSSYEEESPAPVSSGSHNWMSWKPNDDAAMVSNVLGQVAALRGGGSGAGLLSSNQAVQKSAAEAVTEADQNMDLSFGAYQAAATEQTKGTFTEHAQKIDALSAPLAADQNPEGVDMNWGGEPKAPAAPAAPAAPEAPAAPAAPASPSQNSYLSAFPLSMAQQNNADEQPNAAQAFDEQPVKRSPIEIVGAWLQKQARPAWNHVNALRLRKSHHHQSQAAATATGDFLTGNPYAAMLH